MTTQHTPGPWEVIKHGRGPLDSITIRRDYTSGEYVAQIVPTNSDEPLTVAANARLIAAAPELLEACKLVIKEWERAKISTLSIEEHQSLIAAIAKAEGRAS
jgi:hypothetical protein